MIRDSLGRVWLWTGLQNSQGLKLYTEPSSTVALTKSEIRTDTEGDPE